MSVLFVLCGIVSCELLPYMLSPLKGVSFGARRELAFLRATPQENGEKVKLYFPQVSTSLPVGTSVQIIFQNNFDFIFSPGVLYADRRRRRGSSLAL